MNIELRFEADGSVSVVVPQQSGVSFEDAVRRLKSLSTELGVAGLPLTFVGEPERHTHGPETVAHTHARQQAR